MGNKLPVVIIVLAAIAVSIFYSFYLVAFICSLIFLYKIFGKLVSGSAFDSHFLRAVCIAFIYIILLQAVILTSWLFARNINLDFSILTTFLIIFIVHVVTPNSKKRSLPIVNKRDVISIIGALIIALSTIFSTSTVTQSILAGDTNRLIQVADDKSHITLLSEKVTHNRGVLYQTNTTVDTDWSGYPAGWHAANGAIMMAINPHLRTTQDITAAYTISKLFWVMVLLFTFCRVTLALAYQISDKRSFLGMVWILISLYVIGRIFIADVYISGFYSFMPQLISVVLGLLFLYQLSVAKNNSERSNSLLLVITVLIGGTLPWMLPLPTVALTILGILGVEIKKARSIQPIKPLLSKPLYFLPIGLLALGAIAQLYIMMTTKAPNSYSFWDRINFDGGILISSIEFYIFMFVGLVIYCWLLFQKNKTYITYALCMLLPLFILSELISLFQLVSVGHNSYYFYKLINLLSTAVVPLSIVGFYWAIAKLENKNRWLALILFLALFATCLLFFVRPTLHIFEAGTVAI